MIEIPSDLGECFPETLKGRISPEKFREYVRKAYLKLVEKARKEENITYENLRKELRAPMELMGSIIGEISDYEYDHGRPMISVIVVRKDTSYPAEGFFGLKNIPSNLRRGENRFNEPLRKEDKAFCDSERQRAFNFWRNYA